MLNIHFRVFFQYLESHDDPLNALGVFFQPYHWFSFLAASLSGLASGHDFKTRTWKQSWGNTGNTSCWSAGLQPSLTPLRLICRTVTAAGLRWRPAGPHSWGELRRDETRSTWTLGRFIWVTSTLAGPAAALTHRFLVRNFSWRNTTRHF